MGRFGCRENSNHISERRRFVKGAHASSLGRRRRFYKKIELAAVAGCGRFLRRGQGKLKSKAIGKSLTALRRVTFKVVVYERPYAPRTGKVPLDLERPAFHRRFSFPKEPPVAVNALAVAIVLGPVIAEQPEIKEIRRVRQEFEGREIAFIQRTGVGPNPANAMLFQKMNDLRPMPPRMTELNRETKIARQLLEKIAKRSLPGLWRKGGRQLNENDLKFCPERLQRA